MYEDFTQQKRFLRLCSLLHVYASSKSNCINVKITVMIIQVFKKAVFIISMLIIIVTHAGCKKVAGEDYRLPVASTTVLSPHLGTEWAALGNLPDEFSPDRGNFFLGIKNNLFVISPKGTVWQYNVTGGYSLGFAASIPENMPEPAVTFSV